MDVPHDALYWTFYYLGIALFVLTPLMVVLGVMGWLRRLTPMMAAILETVFHLHRHSR